MKKRNPIIVFILSVITLGIYDLYWLAVTRRELNAKTGHKVPSVWFLVSPFILIFISIIMLIAGSTSNMSNNNNYSLSTSTHYNMAGIIGLILIIVASIAMFFISAYWFYKYSKAVDEYTSGKMSTAVAFLTLWIVHVIGVALIQDAYNDTLDGPMSAPAGTAPSGGGLVQPPASTPPPAAEPPQPETNENGDNKPAQ